MPTHHNLPDGNNSISQNASCPELSDYLKNGPPGSADCHAKAAGAQGTPGRTSEPLAVHIVPRLPCQGRYQRLQQKQGLRPPGCQPFPNLRISRFCGPFLSPMQSWSSTH